MCLKGIQTSCFTGIVTFIKNLNPLPGETWTGMTLDPTTGIVYLSSTDISKSTLYSFDPKTGELTTIGSTTVAPGIIAIACDNRGNLYGEDIVYDNLVLIDKTTGQAQIIGSLGFDASYSQGMEFGQDSNLYIAAFNNATYRTELRIADVTTEATQLIGVIGSSFQGGLTELSYLAVPSAGVPWLTADVLTGTIPPGQSLVINVTVNADLDSGSYSAYMQILSNDPANSQVVIPFYLTVVGARIKVNLTDQWNLISFPASKYECNANFPNSGF